jgi:protein-S-isoprenylcysteine O-methyltransferase Ste14
MAARVVAAVLVELRHVPILAPRDRIARGRRPCQAVTMDEDVTGTAAGSSPSRADLLVVGQVLAGLGLLWPGRPRWRLPLPATVGCLALGAAGAALMEEGARFLGRDLTPSVEPRSGARLQTAGPYEISRNPVYAGLLLGSAAVAVLRRRPEPLFAFAALAAVLHVKTGVEEQRLRARFGEAYATYAARTPRLLGLPRPVRLVAAVRAPEVDQGPLAGEVTAR